MLGNNRLAHSVTHLVGCGRRITDRSGQCSLFSLSHLLLAFVNLRTESGRCVVVQEVVARHSSLHDVRREERREHTRCHNNRIDSRIRNAQLATQAGNNKRELTDLHKRETRQHRVLERRATPPATQCTEHDHTYDDHYGYKQDCRPVFYQRRGVDHHTDRHKEDSSKHVLERHHKVLNAMRLQRFRQHHSHNERTQCTAEARFLSRQNHSEAQTQRQNDQRLIVQVRTN